MVSFADNSSISTQIPVAGTITMLSDNTIAVSDGTQFIPVSAPYAMAASSHSYRSGVIFYGENGDEISVDEIITTNKILTKLLSKLIVDYPELELEFAEYFNKEQK